eukprot:254527_1
MSSLGLNLLTAAVIAAGILLFLGLLFGILFLFKWTRRDRDHEPHMPCYFHSLAVTSSLMNMITNIVPFVYCFWTWRAMSDGNEVETPALQLFVLCEFAWHLTKIFDLFIFNGQLKHTFINTPHAPSKCLTTALQIIAFVFIIPVLFKWIVTFVLGGPGMLMLLRLFRLLSPVLYLIDMILVSCAYGRQYRSIARAKASMPQFQQYEFDHINLNDLTKYSMLTAMTCKGAIFVWLCMFVLPMLVAETANTVALIAVVISLDGFLDTLSILMLYPFGVSIYNACCMFNRGGKPRTLSFHNCWDCFVRCTCCVPNTARIKIP